ncbi:hypothetical protein [Actinomyces trachealis]|nr:hypothetical protein [Actinomyces trachealis]
MKIAVIGLGYIGLPTAAVLAREVNDSKQVREWIIEALGLE